MDRKRLSINMNMRLFLKSKAKEEICGIYAIYYGSICLYVGKSVAIRKRLSRFSNKKRETNNLIRIGVGEQIFFGSRFFIWSP